MSFQNWIEILQARAAEQPDAIAQTFLSTATSATGTQNSESNLTFAQLERRARMIAATLQQHVAVGERALLLYAPGLEFTCAFMGCLFAGVVAVPVYPPRRGQMDNRLLGITMDAQPAVVLTSDKIRGELQASYGELMNSAGIQAVATERLPLELAEEWQKGAVSPDTLAFLQYTSGSTGAPKGVMVSHRNLLHNASLIEAGFQHPEGATSVFWLPEYHDMGLIGGILQPLYEGVRSIRMSPIDFLQKPLRWLQAISSYRAASSGAPNFAYELCVEKTTPAERAALDLSCWTLAFTGAEPVRAETLHRFAEAFAESGFHRQSFYPCYGLAEATLMIAGGQRQADFQTMVVNESALTEHVVEKVAQPQEGERSTRTLVGCGSVKGGQQVRIVDPYSRQPAQANHVGEIWVAGSSVAQGYWNKAELSDEIFGAQLADGSEERYLRTGDLGFLHEGELYITGRQKDLIIIRGRNHYPQDIEQSVEKSHPALRAGCGAAFSVDVEEEERLVIAYEVDRHYLNSLNVEEVTTTIRRTVAEHHGLQTAAILLLRTTTIPKTSSGKIQRYACRKGFVKKTLDVVGEWHSEV
ncbi:MAG: fatty acyl-AMP ligase [Caldilineaceae bacterium]